jgi:class 3 adenylate cyclase/tetratricopeptide (TPR) repeat protein
MRCSACSTDNPAENRYCGNCGVRLVVSCPKCGYQNSANQHSCGSCGSSLRLEPGPETGKAAPQRSADGERKQATVLFADIVGSTQLIAGLDPEQAMEYLRPAVTTMCETVERFGGTVVRTLGDGIMALFGAPRAQEGHALMACEAALAMQEAFPHGEKALTLRIGLHSGEVVSDAPNVDLTKERGAHGVTIHLASRVQQMAEPGGVCITEVCYQLVRPYCDVRPLGRHLLKGFPEPIEIYALIGLKAAVATQQFRGTNLTTFRGRDYEVAMLRRALRSTENNDTKVLGISAPPGTGKSRLCYEFAEWCRSRRIPVLEARASVYGHATPLQPVLEFLRLFFRISPVDDAAAARHRIRQRLLALDAAFESDLALFSDFLGVPDPNGPPPVLDPKARHSRLLDAVSRIVRQAGVATSVIIVEDLHWLDEASEEFVAMLVNAAAGTRTMVVLNYRPSYTASWMDRAHFHEVVLADLSPREINALVEELTGGHPELREVDERIAERSGGNPFFAEELVRSLVENTVLVGETGNYRLGMKAHEGTLPGTVQAVIGARIDRLSEIEKEILQIGAIIGKEFPKLVLEQVAGIARTEIEAALDHLCNIELLQERLGVDRRLFAFRHPLIQEVAYTMQLKTRRSALHAAVAQAMEVFYRDRLDEFAGLIAHHQEAAGRFLEAAQYETRAAIWVGKTDSAQALKLWQHVSSLLRTQPHSASIDTLRIMANGQIVNFGWREGMTAEEAKPYFQEAMGWARELDNKVAQMLLLAGYGRIIAASGSADEYVDRVKEALLLLPEAKNVGRDAMLNALLSLAYRLAGKLNEALAANTAALEGASRIEKSDQQILGFNVEQILGFNLELWVLSLRGRILVRLGRFAEAEECLSAVLKAEKTVFEPAVQSIPHLSYVDLAWCRGDAELAAKHAARVAEIAERSGIPYVRVCAFACAGLSKLIAGDCASAVENLVDGLAFARRVKAGLEYEPEMLASLVDAHYRAGEWERAIVVGREAIDVARHRSARLPECHASILCAAALFAAFGADRRDEAAELLHRAEDLIRISGATIYEPLLAKERAPMMSLAG